MGRFGIEVFLPGTSSVIGPSYRTRNILFRFGCKSPTFGPSNRTRNILDIEPLATPERLSTVSSPFMVFSCQESIIYYIRFTKIRAFVGKYGQKISTSVGFTKIRAFVGKCGQKISISVGLTKIRALVGKCG